MANLSDLVGLAGGSGVGGFASGIASGLQQGLGQINQARALGLQEEGQKFQQQAAKDLTYLKGLDLVLQNPAAISAVVPIFKRYGFDPAVLEPLAQSGRESQQAIAAMRAFILNDGEVDEATQQLIRSPIAGKIAAGSTDLLKTMREIIQRKGISQEGVSLATRAADLMGQTSEAGRAAATSAEVLAGESPAPPPLGREPAFRQAGQEAMAAGRRYAPEAFKSAKELFATELSPDQQQVRAAAPVIQQLMVEMAQARTPIAEAEAKIAALPGGKQALELSTTWQAHKARMTAGGTELGKAGILGVPVTTPTTSLSALVGGGGAAGITPSARPPLDRLYGQGLGVFRDLGAEIAPPTATPGAGMNVGQVLAEQAGRVKAAQETPLSRVKDAARVAEEGKRAAIPDEERRLGLDLKRAELNAKNALFAARTGQKPETLRELTNSITDLKELKKDPPVDTTGLSKEEARAAYQKVDQRINALIENLLAEVETIKSRDPMKRPERPAPRRTPKPAAGAPSSPATQAIDAAVGAIYPGRRWTDLSAQEKQQVLNRVNGGS